MAFRSNSIAEYHERKKILVRDHNTTQHSHLISINSTQERYELLNSALGISLANGSRYFHVQLFFFFYRDNDADMSGVTVLSPRGNE